MKVFLSLTLLVGLTLAEPPVYRQQSQNERNKYYFARQQEVETPPEAEAEAPYQASGWKPEGPAFELPQRQQQQQAVPEGAQQQYDTPQATPQQQYGAPEKPQKQYGAPTTPQQQYGAPQAAPQQQYRAPQAAAPQQQYGAPQAAAPQQQYGAPQAAAPQQQYGAPQTAPQQQYRAQSLPQPQRQQYRAYAQIQQQSAAAAAPQRQYGAPQEQYRTASAPQQSYGVPPQQNYGPPEEVTTTQETTSSDGDEATTLPSATESQAEPVDSVNELDEEGEVDEQQRQSGQYYVALPDGRLQRIQYMSTQDIEAMKYFARIQAENVEPLRGPVYAYKPLQKLEFAPTNLRFTVPDPYAPATPLVIREPVRNSVRPAKAAPEKLRQGHEQKEQQQQPLAAEVRYDTPAAIVGLNGANVSPLNYNSGYQAPNNEQRYFISF